MPIVRFRMFTIAMVLLITVVPAGGATGVALALAVDLSGENRHGASALHFFASMLIAMGLHVVYRLMIGYVRRSDRDIVLGFSTAFWQTVLIASWVIGFLFFFALFFILPPIELAKIPASGLGHWDLVIDSPFWFRHSDFPKLPP